MVLVMGLCNSLLYKARIGHENTYDMREKLAFHLSEILLSSPSANLASISGKNFASISGEKWP